MREAVLKGLRNIGIVLDEKENTSKEKRPAWQISVDNKNALVSKVLVIKTNEELEVAQQINECLKQAQ